MAMEEAFNESKNGFFLTRILQLRVNLHEIRRVTPASSPAGEFFLRLTIVYVDDIHISMDIQQALSSCEGFQWDKGNSLKNWLKHRVSEGEAEQAFFNEPIFLVMDPGHSQTEARYQSLGYTDEGRQLFIVFTIRKALVRIISARDMNRKERIAYESFKNNPSIQE